MQRPAAPRYDRRMATMQEDAQVREILSSCPTIAVLGIHDDPARPAAYVPAYLHAQGYRVLGVNPQLHDRPVLGVPVYATLASITEPVDLVDVFRRAELIPAHLPDLLAMRPLPRVVWFQLGIVHEAAARQLEAAGITVIQDRCALAEHRRLGLGAPVRG
jgi:uncharacterized protein